MIVFVLLLVLTTQVLAQQVYFSPHGGCTEAVVRAISGAKKDIRVQAYGFTSLPIANALIAAKRRGVDIRVDLDRSNRSAPSSKAAVLKSAGIRVLYDSAHSIAHSKVMVIDSRIVITGSFNFTKAAENSNLENELVIDNSILAGIYLANFEKHTGHCSP